jgi:hypothetical protein
MKKLTLLLLLNLFLLVFNASAQSPPWQWGYSAGGPGNDLGYGISTDAFGNSYVTGRFNATDSFGSFTVSSYGGPDIFFAKYNSAGTCLWVRHAGSTYTIDPYGDEGRGAAIDRFGNCYFTGNCHQNSVFGNDTVNPASHREIYLVKMDSSGNFLWVRTASGVSNNYSFGVATDQSGYAYIVTYLGAAGVSFGSYVVSPGGTAVIKYDPNGNVVYAASVSDGAMTASGIDVDLVGNAYITGNFSTVVHINSVTYTCSGNQDYITVKLHPTGAVDWARQIFTDSASYSWINAVAVDDKLNVYVTGGYSGSIQFASSTLMGNSINDAEMFIAKYDSSGNEIWGKTSAEVAAFGGDAAGTGITCDQFGHIYVVGSRNDDFTFGSCSSVADGGHTFVMKLDSTGTCFFCRSSSGFNPGAIGQGISVDGIQSAYITGYSKAPVSFDAYTTIWHGGEDMFIAKIGGIVEGLDNAVAENSSFVIYPNPAHGGFTLQLNRELKMEQGELKIYDITGRCVYSKPIRNQESEIINQNFSPGIYFVKVSDGEQSETKKLIIQ